MPVNPPLEEPAIPPRAQRALAAVWISLGLHAAVIALVQVAPPSTSSPAESVIEARLVSAHAVPPAAETPPPAPEADAPEAPPEAVPLLAPSKAAEALPADKPVAPPPAAGPPPAAPAAPAAPPPAPAAPAPAATITSSVDLTYYGARDLDVQPRPLHKIEPDYPEAADRQQLSGTLRLQLRLEADGRISDVEVVSATPPGVFDESAIKAFRGARFAPAQKNGRPVRAQVLIEVVYDWEGRRL